MTDDEINVAVALATLRGDMNAGFERLEGQLKLMAQAADNAAKDIEATNSRVTALEGRVSELEARRWPLGPLTVLTGLVAALAAVAAYFAAT